MFVVGANVVWLVLSFFLGPKRWGIEGLIGCVSPRDVSLHDVCVCDLLEQSMRVLSSLGPVPQPCASTGHTHKLKRHI